MPYISQQAFEQALQSAKVIEKHGRSFEGLSGLLKESALTEPLSESMKYAGQRIQDQGQAMGVLVEQALQEDEQYWLERYIVVHHHQCQAVIEYLVSIVLLMQATRSLLAASAIDVSSSDASIDSV